MAEYPTGRYYPWGLALKKYQSDPGKYYDFYLEKCRCHIKQEQTTQRDSRSVGRDAGASCVAA